MYRFSFPLLTAGDIQLHLKTSLQLNFVTEEDITKPKSDTIKMIYTRLLSIIDSTLDQDSFKPGEQDQKELRFADCHETSIPTIRLFKELNFLFSRIGCSEDPFRLSDLISPDFKRTRYFLSAIINFLKFSLEELNVKLETNQEFIRGRLLNVELKKAEEQFSKLSAEVAALNKFQNDNLALVNQKNEQIAELDAEKARIVEERRKIEEKMELLRMEIEGTEQSIKSLCKGMEDENYLTKTLKDCIVENPEEFIGQLNEKKEKYSNLSRLKDNEKAMNEDVKGKVEKMAKIVNKVKEISVILETISLSKSKYDELCKTLESHKQAKLNIERNVHEKRINDEHPETSDLFDLGQLESENNNVESRSASISKSIESKKHELDYVSKQNQELKQDYQRKIKFMKVFFRTRKMF
jgi:DNA repair exonuclease SbcCD ATPase subunit